MNDTTRSSSPGTVVVWPLSSKYSASSAIVSLFDSRPPRTMMHT
eukprot:CAMPEP_0180350008 /NCGR_PEP_ID=MMETSP0989-20121125/5770_1 /TAXON_ID=697907 /ORGANISM="non described non described, Strain CCMP2293" /LENGTH=43 /DNA_ID= /DNA_START= /DNA_END= /DNA_ORIENTATION=